MQINSSFIDNYDLQHSMDKDFIWDRESFTYTQKRTEVYKSVAAMIYYVGRVYAVTHGAVLPLPYNDAKDFFTKHLDEPILIAIPSPNKEEILVMVNPSTIQVSGFSKIESNPYRMHQEIETFLKEKGKLKNGTGN